MRWQWANAVFDNGRKKELSDRDRASVPEYKYVPWPWVSALTQLESPLPVKGRHIGLPYDWSHVLTGTRSRSASDFVML
jgi:hypothetical protein